MRSHADSGCATCRRFTGPTRAAAADPGRRQVPRLQCARVLDAVRALRIHVEPTPCEREPASGLGEPVRWSARHPPGLSRFTRTRPSRRSRSMVRGASAPLTLFREYPGPCARAAGRFRPRRGLGGRPASRRRRPHRRCRRRGSRRGPEGTDAAGGGGGRWRDAAGGRARERARAGCDGARDAESRGGRNERRRRQRGVAPARRPRCGRRDAAAVARPGRPGLRSRVLLSERGDRSARDVPRARAAARHARPARAVPPRSRDAVRPWLRTRRDTESVYPLQRRLPLRRAARISPPCRRRAPRRPGTTRGSSSTAAGFCSRARPTRSRIRATCSRGSTRVTCVTSGSRSEIR